VDFENEVLFLVFHNFLTQVRVVFLDVDSYDSTFLFPTIPSLTFDLFGKRCLRFGFISPDM
jgi:hypothetical protein